MTEDVERHAMKMAKKKAARDKIMATKLGLNQISPQGRGLQKKKRYETPGFNNNIDRRETPDLAPQPVIVLD